MALGSTQPLAKMSTRNISWRLRQPVLKADNLTTLMCRVSWKSGSLNLLEPSGPRRPPNVTDLHIYICIYYYYFPIVSYLFTAIVFYVTCIQLLFLETRLRFLHSDFLCSDPCVIFRITNIPLNNNKCSDECPCCLVCQGYKFVSAVSAQEGAILRSCDHAS